MHHLRGVYGLVLVGLWLMLPPLAVGPSLTCVYSLVLGAFWLMLPPLAVGPLFELRLRPSFGGFLVDAPAFGGRALFDLRLRPSAGGWSLCSALRAFGGEVTWISASGKHLSGLLRISLVFSSGWGRSARLVRADRPHPDDTGVPGRLCYLYWGEVDPEPFL